MYIPCSFNVLSNVHTMYIQDTLKVHDKIKSRYMIMYMTCTYVLIRRPGPGLGILFFFPLFFQPIKVRCTQTHTHGKSHKGPGPGLGAWGPQPQITG